MPKPKSKPGIVPWLSADPGAVEKRFIQVGNTLLFNRRFQKLGVGARWLYLCMAMESGGRRGFLFPQAKAKAYGFSPSSLRRYIDELEENGFLVRSSMKNLRKPNEYEFSLSWKTLFDPHPRPPPMATCSISDPK